MNDYVQFLAAKLRRMLSEKEFDSPEERFRWLIGLQNEYFRRWEGFARIEEIGLSELVEHSVTFAVRAANLVISEEFIKDPIPEFPYIDWQKFCNAFDEIEADSKSSTLVDEKATVGRISAFFSPLADWAE